MLIAAAGLWTYAGPGPKAKSGEATTVVLRKGSGLSQIALALEREGVVRSSSVFLAAAQFTGGSRSLKAGEYEFASGASMSSILQAIRDGRIVRRQVTIPEGMTADMVVDILNAQPVLTGVTPTPAEGSVLPETYDIQRGEDRAVVLKRMTDAHDALMETLWAQRQPGLPFTTRNEAITLASVVEKETGIASERPQVAAVFVNRLRLGMRLESDPTIIYGLTRGRPLGRGLRASEVASDTPYNTYRIAGLPPTPIANPGRAAIAAVLNPPKSEALFFVADGTGGHVFAATYDEHLRNVEKWRRIERERAAQ
ncbi:endolytic transglycosylase MltG [Caulobacter sp. 73W]|uniref:Endolytic murein transglycosylase n=1 Tax=Caulobacter sp. 73W TaxID=3161137 RepID=A0AB39KY40_9CAUL